MMRPTALYGMGYVDPRLTQDGADYTTADVVSQMPRQRSLMDLAGIDPKADRDAILPFAQSPGQRTPPSQWNSTADVMRNADATRGGAWQLALPQFAVDAVKAVDAVGTSGLMTPYTRTDEAREAMTEHAGAIVGPQMAAGFMRNALARPIPGQSELGIFGGRMAKTADQAALAKAEAMDAAGTPREQIWSDTGWFKGTDGKWRFEIDDSGARWKMLQALDEGDGLYGNFLDHRQMFDAYPALQFHKATTNTDGSFFDWTNNEIGISPSQHAPTKTALHEGQHAIQHMEGFGSGGNASQLGVDAYNKIAGEVEARAVEKRSRLTPEQRRARAPWLDYDVPEANQIVRYGNAGPQMSLPPDAPGIRAYHGSPHDFDKFSLDKIGTGEGAQAYGHGLYFAEAEAVAKQYRDNLAGKMSLPDPFKLRRLTEEELAARPPPEPGRLYEVRINADPDQFLDWDKPLSQQSEKVRRALTSALPYGNKLESALSLPQLEMAVSERMAAKRYDGETQALIEKRDAARNAAREGLHERSINAMLYDIDPSAANGGLKSSKALREAGIPGIKYLDQGSRGAGEGSRNYVVFDDRMVEIVRKYMAAGMTMSAAIAAAQSGGAEAKGILP